MALVVPGSVPASVRRRLVAFVIDAVAALVLGGGLLLGGLAGQWRSGTDLSAVTVVGAVVLVASSTAQWAMIGTSGRSIGGLLAGQRVVDQATGGPIGLRRSLVRCLALTLAWVLPVVGPVLLVVSGARDPEGRRRGWHDRLVRAVVVDLVIGVDPRTAAPSPSQAAERLDGLLGGRDERRRLRPARAAIAAPPPVTAEGIGATSAVPGGAGDPAEVAVSVTAPGGGTRTGVDYDPWPTGGRPGRAYPERAERRSAQRAGPDDGGEAGMVSTQGRIVPDAPYERVSSAPYRALEDEVEQTQLREARSKVAYAPTRAQTRPRATLLLWDNRVVVLDGTVLVGRNPTPREGESLPVQVIAVLDRGRSVSKTHLAMGVDADGVWLKDRSSTNGTVVTLTDGQQILCAPEQTVRVPVGASVAFGDYWLTVAG